MGFFTHWVRGNQIIVTGLHNMFDFKPNGYNKGVVLKTMTDVLLSYKEDFMKKVLSLVFVMILITA